jgi:hypothetical protein
VAAGTYRQTGDDGWIVLQPEVGAGMMERAGNLKSSGRAVSITFVNT